MNILLAFTSCSAFLYRKYFISTNSHYNPIGVCVWRKGSCYYSPFQKGKQSQRSKVTFSRSHSKLNDRVGTQTQVCVTLCPPGLYQVFQTQSRLSICCFLQVRKKSWNVFPDDLCHSSASPRQAPPGAHVLPMNDSAPETWLLCSDSF